MEWKINHPIVYPTVDCAIFSDNQLNFIYLARKPGQKLWRFVGGFVDVTDSSYQCAAEREAHEETGVWCETIDFITSIKIDDPRYKDSEDAIMTSFFAMQVILGQDAAPSAKDDINELKLFHVDELTPDIFVDEHKPLSRILYEWLIIRKLYRD